MATDLREKMMAEIINLFADKFGNHAVLKGGMELRLLDSPRFTNDLDYQFVPYASKNDVRDEILTVLQAMHESVVTVTAHSTCIRYLILQGGVRIQVEVNVATDCKTQVISTAALARTHQLQPRLVRAMRLDCALAHKLAAWNERNLIRDLYDASFLTSTLDILPEMETLMHRLVNIKFRQKKTTATGLMSLSELADKLEASVALLNAKAVEEELRDYFSPVELVGLELKIKVGIRKVIDFLRRGDELG